MFDRIMAPVAALALLFLVFLSGLAASYFQLWPYRRFVDTWKAFQEVIGEPDRLMPAVHDFAGVRIHDRAAMAPGLTFITSYFPETDWNAGARLIDADGNIQHSWKLDAEAIFGPRLGLPYIHGSYLFPNGDILANIEFTGLARISACGALVWKIDHPVTHHSISPSDDGTFWVSANRELSSSKGREEKLLRALRFPVAEDLLLHVSADGKILQTISTIEVIDRNGLEDVVLRIKQHPRGDLFHLNDVDVLTAAMADDYPLFEAGDIAVSLRDLHLLMVLDPATLRVKWHTFSDTLLQHDVDFFGNGWVGAFDNRFDATDRGTILGGSRVVAIRPDTGERRILFPTEKSPPFHTKWSGKWQKLANGNLLLTEARSGRALEVGSDGAPVWEWVIERFDASRIPEVMEATRYPIDPASVAKWDCSGPPS